MTFLRYTVNSIFYDLIPRFCLCFHHRGNLGPYQHNEVVQTDVEPVTRRPAGRVFSELVSAGSWHVMLQSVCVFVCVLCESPVAFRFSGVRLSEILPKNSCELKQQCCFVSSSLDSVSECWSR